MQKSLLPIYKSFTKPHLVYGNVIYDRACKELLHHNLKSL